MLQIDKLMKRGLLSSSLCAGGILSSSSRKLGESEGHQSHMINNLGCLTRSYGFCSLSFLFIQKSTGDSELSLLINVAARQISHSRHARENTMPQMNYPAESGGSASPAYLCLTLSAVDHCATFRLALSPQLLCCRFSCFLHNGLQWLC